MEFKKRDLLLNEVNSEEGITQKVLSKIRGIRDRAKSEFEETKALVRILTHAIRTYAKTREFDLDEKDKTFIKGQSIDVVKNIVLMIVAIIPLPIPLTPFLVIFGKKIGVDFIPKQQDIPEKGKKKEKLDEVETIKGGKADNMTLSDIAKKHDVSIKDIAKEIRSGIKIEREHTRSKRKAKEIAMDHVFEFPNYYTDKKYGVKASEKGLEKIDEVRVKRKKYTHQPSEETKRAVKVCVDLSMEDVKKFLKRDDVQINIVNIKTITYGKSKLLNQEITLDLTDSEGKDIKLSRSKFIDLSEIFHETLQSMGMNDIKGEYYHFFFEEQDEDAINENMHKKFFNLLKEEDETETPYEIKMLEEYRLIYNLCDQATKRKLKSSPFCDLKDYYETTPAKEKVLASVFSIYNFLVEGARGLNRGVFPRLIRIALNSEDPAQTLYIISEFIQDKTYDNDESKIKLKQYKGRDISPANLDDFLNTVKSKTYSEYEESLTKNEMSLERTSLRLEYNCTDDISVTLIKLLEIIKKSNPEQKYEKFNEVFKKVTDCLYSFMNSDTEVVKADARYNLNEPMMYEDEPVIMPGDYIEIKKMDPEVDSYLSEFFSIFKQTKLKSKKKEYIILYNYFIDVLFEWILKHGENYRQKVLNNMSGIIYDNNVFVPKDQIEVYWSNKGQRGCDEKRLSLRYRLKPGLKKMVGYVYVPGKGTESLVRKEIRDLPQEFKERYVCRNTHFNLLDYSEDYISKEEKEKKNNVSESISIIITESQYKTILENIANDNVLRNTIKSFESTVTDKNGYHYVFDDKDSKTPKTFVNNPNKKKGGTLTIGWGHTGDVAKIGKKISNSVAEKLLTNDITNEENKTKKLFPKYNDYPTYVKRALVNAVYRGEAKSTYEWVKAINSGKWDLGAKKYLEGWDIDFSKADDPRYKGGVADRMVTNQNAFKQYSSELKKGVPKPKVNNDQTTTPKPKSGTKQLTTPTGGFTEHGKRLISAIKNKQLTVQQGDTLSNIVNDLNTVGYKIKIADIKNYNNLKSDVIKIGQTLKLK